MNVSRERPYRTLPRPALAAGLLAVLPACAGNFLDLNITEGGGGEIPTPQEEARARTAISANVTFRVEMFSTSTVPGEADCAGDARIYHDLYPVDDDGNTVSSLVFYDSNNDGIKDRYGHVPVPFARDMSLRGVGTLKPDFLKNVSVDLTDQNANYTENKAYVACSLQNTAGAPHPSACARFDMYPYTVSGQSVNPNASFRYDELASVLFPTSMLSTALQKYGSEYYTLIDYECIDSGPIAGTDADATKKFAGGVDFDIDRAKLGETENLLLHLSYIPLGVFSETPVNDQGSAAYGVAVADRFGQDQAAQFKVMLLATGGPSVEAIQSATQPRYLTHGYLERPKEVETLAVLSNADGSLKQDQILIPLATNPEVDRIRVERVSGSAILVDASLYRMGPQ